VLCAQGAAKIYAVDIGHDQLHARLKDISEIISMEKLDARNLTQLTTANKISRKAKRSSANMMKKVSKLLNDPEYFSLFKLGQDQNFTVEHLRYMDSDDSYEPKKLTVKQLETLNEKALAIETKHGLGDMF